MTETELRQKVVDTASSWLGTQEGTSRHGFCVMDRIGGIWE